MGEFKAGILITGLIIYNILLYTIVAMTLGSLGFYGVTGSGVQMGEVSFSNTSQSYNVNETTQLQDRVSNTGFLDTISFITGIGTSSYNINLPGIISYFVIILFWILNLVLMLWALYMSLPFLH